MPEKLLSSQDDGMRRLKGVIFFAHWPVVVDDADVCIAGDKAFPCTG